jgi:hypothetical protein
MKTPISYNFNTLFPNTEDSKCPVTSYVVAEWQLKSKLTKKLTDRKYTDRVINTPALYPGNPEF